MKNGNEGDDEEKKLKIFLTRANHVCAKTFFQNPIIDNITGLRHLVLRLHFSLSRQYDAYVSCISKLFVDIFRLTNRLKRMQTYSNVPHGMQIIVALNSLNFLSTETKTIKNSFTSYGNNYGTNATVNLFVFASFWRCFVFTLFDSRKCFLHSHQIQSFQKSFNAKSFFRTRKPFSFSVCEWVCLASHCIKSLNVNFLRWFLFRWQISSFAISVVSTCRDSWENFIKEN